MRRRDIPLRKRREIKPRYDAEVIPPALESAVEIGVGGLVGVYEGAVSEDDLLWYQTWTWLQRDK
jgi:hypothetical protein